MFEEERPHLLPLPAEPFRYYNFGERVVHLDGYVEVESAYYCVPPGYLGQRLPVQWDALYVRLLHPKTGQLLREYLRQEKGRRRWRPEDIPNKARPEIAQLLGRAGRAGKNIGVLAEEIFRRERDMGVRRILGVLSLARRRGPAVVDEACGVALEMGVPSYRFVRRYLERATAPTAALKQVDPLIRELTHYRDLINRITQGEAQ
jgi:hypothetical protein